MRLTLRQVTVLHAIMRGGSAAAAAQALHISQPAVSKLVTSMEDELGYKLFRRTGRGLEPTSEAISLMPFIETALGDFDRLHQHASNLRIGTTGTLTIAVNYTLFASFVAPAANRLHFLFPSLSIDIRILPAAQIISSVINRQADIGLTYGPIFHTNIDLKTIARWPAVCAFPRDHRLLTHSKVHASDLRDESIITYSEDTPIGLAFRRIFENLGLTFSASMILSNTPSVLSMAERGAGVALVDHFRSFESVFPALTWRPFSPRIEISAVLFRLKDTTLTPPLRLLLDLLLKSTDDNDNLVSDNGANESEQTD